MYMTVKIPILCIIFSPFEHYLSRKVSYPLTFLFKCYNRGDNKMLCKVNLLTVLPTNTKIVRQRNFILRGRKL